MSKEDKKLIRLDKKTRDVFYNLALGMESARDLLGFNDEDLQETLRTHAEKYHRMRLYETEYNFRMEVKDLEVQEAKEEMKFVAEEVEFKYRSGEKESDIKITDKSVKSLSEISEEYQEAKRIYFEKKKEHLKLKRERSFIHDMVSALEHKKDCIVSYSSNYRAEMEHNLNNLQKKVRKYQNREDEE